MDFPGHFQHIFQQLNHQRLHAQLCDCVVVVGAQTFQAHRSILAACSSHFRALLNSSDEMEGPDGGRDGGPSVLTLDPGVVTPEAFSTLLDMIYTSALSLGASNVMDVLLAASHLHLNTVVKACKLHLSRKNFPAAPPKGWRSVQQQQQSTPSQAASTSQQQVSSVMVVDLDKEEVGMEVSQSGGDEESEVRIIDDRQPAAMSQQRKRKSQEDMLCDRKRTGRAPGETYKECSPTVTRSVAATEEGDLLSPDCLMSIDRLWENQGVDSNEVKYEAEKGEADEMQLPSQSDSGTGDASAWEGTHNADGGFVVKIKEGEEEAKEPQVALVEVKTENTALFSSELDRSIKSSPPLPLQDCTHNLDGNLSNGKMTTDPGQADVTSLPTQLCTDLHKESEDLGEDSVDGEGLESLSELAFTCFLNPSSENVMGGLEEDDSLASLTAAATAAAAASDAHAVSTESGEQSQNAAEGKAASDSSSSLVFPVTSVPLQQLLPEQRTNFSDTIILQPAQNPLTGFLSGIRPGLTLEASLVTPSRVCKNSGTTTFRRIAPKVPPGSEASADPCSGSVGDATRPPLTRASEDVLSKCKKAAAEDHVLLVEGEKKYACKICCKTFMNLTDCKKHIRVHTGEKPYPCPNCGKRFSQSSHLYKHSKNTCLNWKDDQAFSDTLLLPTDLVKDSN